MYENSGFGSQKSKALRIKWLSQSKKQKAVLYTTDFGTKKAILVLHASGIGKDQAGSTCSRAR